jgi:hypothetical protein
MKRIVFDLLSTEGERVMQLPYAKRRELLEQLNLNGRYWSTPDVFNDGEALFDAVCEHELEAWSRNATRANTCRASAAGSKRKTAATGATSSNARARSTHAARASSSDPYRRESRGARPNANAENACQEPAQLPERFVRRWSQLSLGAARQSDRWPPG